MVVCIVVFLLLLVPCMAEATTYYVATTGNNSNNGTSESTPFLTMQKCADVMVAGDTCNVGGGTYNASGVVLGRSGTASAPITLQAASGARPILSCNAQTQNDAFAILFKNSAGYQTPIGWVNVSGIEVQNCYNGLKFTNLHDAIISNMHLHGNANQGILGSGGARVSMLRNVIHENGPLGSSTSNLEHGIYIVGDAMVIRRNVIYGNQAYGIQLDGNKSYTVGGKYSSVEFARSTNWIIEGNTIAYNKTRSGLVVWGPNGDGARIENNIFYENGVTFGSGEAQGIQCTSCTGSTGLVVKNNHYFASGSGATVSNHASLVGTVTGNVVNVSPPAFVDGGSNSLPVSPDFRLTANAPVDIARSNEFPNNSTNVVGAFKTLASPTCSITANRMTCTYESVTPIRNLSATGVTIGCTGSACPGSPAASTVQNIAGTDSQLEAVIIGITGNACEAANQTWTKSYNASTGSWTGSDNIGAYPGLHQKMFSFTSLAVTNNCTGSGPPSSPGTPYIKYLFTDGSGTTVTNTGSFGASGNGTLSSGVTWGTGSVTMTSGTSQSLSIPDGNAIDPTATDLTIGFLVNLPAGAESLSKAVFGAPLDSAPIGERFYVSMLGGTWRLGIQGNNDGTATDLATNAGLQHICVTANATTDTVTLHKNGVASVVAGGVRAITSYAIPGNFQLGLLPGLTNGPTATYSHFQLYHSLEDCDALYQAAIAPPATPTGTFSQTGVQFQAVHTEANGSVIVLPSPSATKKVAKGGAVGVALQVECNNCQQTAFRLAARDNGTGSWLQVPTTETAANLYMWGSSSAQYLNTGTVSTRVVENGCTVVDGSTLVTAAQIPSLTLPASGCTVLRYLLRVRAGASGYTEVRVEREGGVEFTGSYSLGRIDFINAQAGGIGF